MADKLTPQQEMAVSNRGGKLLVSAAAGSGKTKVLVDRLLSYLLDPVSPANLDEFLIITYTKAAASELRGKIANKLSEKIAEDPDNRHLQRQMQRLYLTPISTVHSFCSDILKEYAYLVDLPADFRVADENECQQLREHCMSQCLEEAYACSEDADFRGFVDSQGFGRDDRLVPEILLSIYDRSRCHLSPREWLNNCISNADTSEVTDAAQTIWGSYLLQDLKEHLSLQIEVLTICAKKAEQAEELQKPAALLTETIAQLQHLQRAETWDETVARSKIDYGRLTFSKKCTDTTLCEQIKAVRSACKKSLEKKLKAFSDDNAVVLEDLSKSASSVRGIVKLVDAFDRLYDQAKRKYRILDFSDLEHRMLDLLLGKGRTGITVAAKEIGNRFREIMVDEYQDSNAVQDAIFSALTVKKQNCFMVGDVKQSIYQFRLADPRIFLDKYNSYVNAEDAMDLQGRKVVLSSNFRSGGAVLAGVNDIFTACMSPKVGGLIYGEDEALHEGISHRPLGEPEVELWTIPVKNSTYEEEANFVAQRVVELTDGSHFVRDGEKLRPIQVQDIAILLRSPNSVGSYYCDALAAQGIRCTTGGGDDLLQAQEVMVLRSILQIISNPRQDIPLLTVITSPVFCVSADDLAMIRSKMRNGNLYDALLQSELSVVQSFLHTLSIWRRESKLYTLAQLLESIFSLTKIDGIYASMDNGEVRRRNLYTFYQLAIDFEKVGRKDLEQFLEHMNMMEEKGMVVTGEQSNSDSVTLMSIHKSKGLEFPVVFVSGLSREFNRESTRGPVLCDQTLGLGLTAMDEKNRVRYPTIAKRAIAAKITADSLSEEMRVLYVALTRARDRLIMTYASQTLEKDLLDLNMRNGLGSSELLTQDAVCSGDWVLMAALQRIEAGELFSLAEKPHSTKTSQWPWRICVTEAPEAGEKEIAYEANNKTISLEYVKFIKENSQFVYPYLNATVAPSKQTATQRKGRQKDEEVSENTRDLRKDHMVWRKPSFLLQTNDATQIGKAMHTAMQYICYTKCFDAVSVRNEIDRMTVQRILTPEQVQMINCDEIVSFFATDIGKKLQRHSNVLREFKFSILDDAEHFDATLHGEKILLQGVVDCALIDEDGITVIDFKTDFVTETTLQERINTYTAQVDVYAHALGKIYQLPIKESYLYFFRINRLIKI